MSRSSQGLTEGVMPFRVQSLLDGELNYRHIRLRKHEPHGHPGAMIEAAFAVHIASNPRITEQSCHTPGKVGIAMGRIFYLVQLGGKSREVMDGLQLSCGSDSRLLGRPVG